MPPLWLQLVHDGTWLAVAMLYVALVFAAIVFAAVGAQKLIERRIARELRELDDGLPAHAPGPIRTGRSHRRKLHRDLVLLLVVNTDSADA
jgi:hypothetical protein